MTNLINSFCRQFLDHQINESGFKMDIKYFDSIKMDSL